MKGELMMDDDAILDLFWMLSESAVTETSKEYGQYCYAIANSILRSKEDSEEYDTYLRAWDSAPVQRPTVFRAFIGKITRNLSLGKFKGKRAKERGGDDVALICSELADCIPSSNNVEMEYESGH
jgi:RNA polymerase sigma-70 factor (ECF subfamily)